MEEVGLIAIFDTEDFNRGLSDYLGGVSQANRAADDGQQSGFNFAHALEVAVGNALLEVAKLAVDAAIKIGEFAVSTVTDAISVEDAFSGIIKTTDGLVDANGELNDVGQELMNFYQDLAREVPVAVEELMEIGELGGQLGIQRENLLQFTETIAAVGVSTNIAGEEASMGFAQFMNVMGTSQDEVDNLASSIVFLGNNFATTEKDILNFSQRIAGAGAIADLTEGDVMGISAAFSSVGVTAEAGGTAVQKTILSMNTAVAQGTGQLDVFAETAGLTTEEFSTMWEEDAAGAFAMFVEGLGEAGDDAVGILDELELKDQRLISAFLSMGENSELLTSAISDGNKAFEENTALSEEAEAKYRTTQSQIQILKNNFRDFGIEIGQVVLPYINDFIEVLVPLIDEYGPQIAAAFENIVEKMEPFINFLLNGIEGGDLFSQVMGELNDLFSTTFAQSIVSVGNAMENLLGDRAENATTFLKQELIPAFNQMKNTVAVVGLLVRKSFSALWQTIKPIFESLFEAIKNIHVTFEDLEPAVNLIKNLFQAVGLVIAGLFITALAIVSGVIGGIAEAIKEMLEIWEDGTESVEKIFEGFAEKDMGKIMKNLGGLLVKAFVGIFKIIFKLVKGFVNGFLDFFRNLKKELVGNSIIPDMMDEIRRVIENVLDSIKRFVSGWIDKIVLFFTNLANDVETTWDNMWKNIKTTVSSVTDSVKRTITRWIETIETKWSNFVGNLQTGWDDFWTGLKDGLALKFENLKLAIATGMEGVLLKFNEYYDSFVEKGKDIINKIIEGVNAVKENLFTTISGAITSIPGKLAEIVEEIKEIGTTIVQAIADGIEDSWAGKVIGAIKDNLNKMASKLSESWQGALLVGAKIVEKISDGISNLWSEAGGVIKTIAGKFASFVSDLGESFGGIVAAGEKIVEMIKQGVSNSWNAFVNWVKDKLLWWFDNEPPEPGGQSVGFPGGAGDPVGGGFETGGGTTNNNRTINVEVNPTYTNVQSEAGVYHDVLAALQAVGT